MRLHLQYLFVLKICLKRCMLRLFIFELLTFIAAGVMHHVHLFQLLKYFGPKARWNVSTGKCKPGHNCSSIYSDCMCVIGKSCMTHFCVINCFLHLKLNETTNYLQVWNVCILSVCLLSGNSYNVLILIKCPHYFASTCVVILAS